MRAKEENLINVTKTFLLEKKSIKEIVLQYAKDKGFLNIAKEKNPEIVLDKRIKDRLLPPVHAEANNNDKKSANPHNFFTIEDNIRVNPKLPIII